MTINSETGFDELLQASFSAYKYSSGNKQTKTRKRNEGAQE
jgi:hypothetical protein